ncbi:MAG: hypothetical protein MK183_00060 [Verrucomicrobiales bacterium]|nr:hypothetical protein [Verrucomicrobiales bacterium]
MARRARQGLSPIQITCIAVGLVGVGLVAVLTFSSSFFSPDNSLRSVSELNIGNYITSGNSMGGTVWRVTGTIDEKLRWTRDRGQVVSVYIEQGSTKESLPIVVPEKFKDISINVGDRFTFKVEVAEKQFLVARELVRS